MRKIILCMLCGFFITVSAFADNLKVVYGPTVAGDTLLQIAVDFRPNNQVTTEQVMLAFLRANPDAFANDNVNSLMTGCLLKLPDAAQIQKISAAAAANEIYNQNREWKKHILKPRRHVQVVVSAPVVIPAPLPPPPVVVPATPVPDPAVQNLIKQVSALEAEQAAMRLQIGLLEQKIAVMKTENVQEQKNLFASYAAKLERRIDAAAIVLLGSTILFMLFIEVVFWLWRKKKIKPHAPVVPVVVDNVDLDEKDEFNLMDSKEGIAAKLNLARAYINMENFEAAKSILHEVAITGDDAQKIEANDLLNSIN